MQAIALTVSATTTTSMIIKTTYLFIAFLSHFDSPGFAFRPLHFTPPSASCFRTMHPQPVDRGQAREADWLQRRHTWIIPI
jgi:hypothetical protein